MDNKKNKGGQNKPCENEVHSKYKYYRNTITNLIRLSKKTILL